MQEIDPLPDQASHLRLLLESLFSSPDSKTRKEAEIELNHLSTSKPDAFFPLLFEVLLSRATKDESRDSVIVYLIYAIKQKLSLLDITDNWFLGVSLQIFAALKDEKLSLKHKQNLKNGLIVILSKDLADVVKAGLFPNIIEALNSTNLTEILAGLITLQTTLLAANNLNAITMLYKEVLGMLGQCATKLQGNISNAFSSLAAKILEVQSKTPSSNVPPNIHELNVEIQLILYTLETMKIWIEIFFAFASKFNSDVKLADRNNAVIQSLCSDPGLFHTFSQILSIHLNSNKQIKDCIISTCGINVLDENINEIKGKTLEWFIRLMGIVEINFAGQGQIIRTGFVANMNAILSLTVKSLLGFCMGNSNVCPSFLDHKKNEYCLIKLLNFLNKCIIQIDYFQPIFDAKIDLIVHSLIPFLTITKQELEHLHSHPEEFVALTSDICDKHISENYKVVAAQTLDLLCDHIDGALSFATKLVGEVLNESLKNKPEVVLSESLARLCEKSIFVFGTSVEVRVETGFLVFSLLSHLIKRRSEIMVSLLLSHYLGHVFVDPRNREFYKKYLAFLLENLEIKTEVQNALCLQSIESLQTIFDDDDLKKRNASFLQDLLSRMGPLISSINYVQFFDLLQDILKNFSKKISTLEDKTLQVLTLVVSRLCLELSATDNRPSTGIITIKCFNIVRTFVEQSNYMMSFADQIDKITSPIYQHLDRSSPEHIEDILSIILAQILRTKSVPKSIESLLPLIRRVVERRNGLLGTLFQVFNGILRYGEGVFLSSAQSIEFIIEVGIGAMFPSNPNANEANHMEGALILQLVIQNFSGILNVVQLEQILMKSLQRLQSVTYNFLRGSILGVFISAFSCNSPLITEILQKNQVLDLVVQLILTPGSYATVYDRKIFVIGLSPFLNKEKTIFSDKIGALMDMMVTFLMMQKLQDKSDRKRRTIERGYLENILKFDEQGLLNLLSSENMTDDQEGESDEEEEDFLFLGNENPEYEAKSILESFSTKIKQLDEFDHFKSTISELKQRSQGTFLEVCSALPANKQNYLREVLFSQRVTLGTLETEKTVVRKIVKIKGRKMQADDKK